MKLKNRKLARRLRVHQRIRKVLEGTAEVPRLSVYKSNKCIYAQLIDDEQGHTLLATSSRALEGSGVNIERARSVGADIAEKALSKGIETAVFDRSGYLYHGRIRALAEAAREKGLKL